MKKMRWRVSSCVVLSCFFTKRLCQLAADEFVPSWPQILGSASRLPMGSCPVGTLCAYCGKNLAGYILDGAAGPVCMRGPDDLASAGVFCEELPSRR